MRRRALLSTGAALLGGCVVGWRGRETPDLTLESSYGNLTVEDVSPPLDAANVTEDDDGVYRATPPGPNCPQYEDGEVVGHHWGMVDRTESRLDREVRSHAAAYEWAADEFDDPTLVVGVRAVEWTGDRRPIAGTHDTDEWYLVRVASNRAYLLVPREGHTETVEYWYGDC